MLVSIKMEILLHFLYKTQLSQRICKCTKSPKRTTPDLSIFQRKRGGREMIALRLFLQRKISKGVRTPVYCECCKWTFSLHVAYPRIPTILKIFAPDGGKQSTMFQDFAPQVSVQLSLSCGQHWQWGMRELCITGEFVVSIHLCGQKSMILFR